MARAGAEPLGAARDQSGLALARVMDGEIWTPTGGLLDISVTSDWMSELVEHAWAFET